MTGPAPIEAVLVTADLDRRPARPPDYKGESRALADLVKLLKEGNADFLQELAEAALRLCRAGSAGISISEVEQGNRVFRWHAVAGQWSCFVGSTMPHETSPCGVAMDRNSSVLLSHPE